MIKTETTQPVRRAARKTERPFYSRIKRISLYKRHAVLKPFFDKLEAMPNDIANETLLRAISLGADAALQEGLSKIERRMVGQRERATDDLQPALIEMQ